MLNNTKRDLSSGSENAFNDLLNVAESAYFHFRSTYLQVFMQSGIYGGEKGIQGQNCRLLGSA